MRATTVVLLSAFLVLVSGCSVKQVTVAPPIAVATSSESTEALPGGGVRSVYVGDDLRFSAEVSSTTLEKSDSITVRLELKNSGPTAIHWDGFRMGYRGVSVPRGGYFGGDLPPVPWTYPGSPPAAPPFVLASGETTSKVLQTTDMQPGAAVEGSGGPSAAAPEIIVHVAN